MKVHIFLQNSMSLRLLCGTSATLLRHCCGPAALLWYDLHPLLYRRLHKFTRFVTPKAMRRSEMAYISESGWRTIKELESKALQSRLGLQTQFSIHSSAGFQSIINEYVTLSTLHCLPLTPPPPTLPHTILF